MKKIQILRSTATNEAVEAEGVAQHAPQCMASGVQYRYECAYEKIEINCADRFFYNNSTLYIIKRAVVLQTEHRRQLQLSPKVARTPTCRQTDDGARHASLQENTVAATVEELAGDGRERH